MGTQSIDKYRTISTNQLVRAIVEAKSSSERFCFIFGSGASASSNIPTGGELERRWMAEMEENPGLGEIRAVAEGLREEGHLEYDFKEIEEAWQNAKASGDFLSSKYYFDIYKLRFFPNHRNGYHYLERIMANAKPSFGYHPLALMLTDEGKHNLVITTNFDSLVEDALFLYTDSKPLVINHELLADFAGDPNISRPIIAKIHRGIFFDPLNRPEETNELKGKWHDVLAAVFQCYTPVVIGYGGGDNSLMELMADENIRMKNGIYWCYVEEYGPPAEKIETLVQQKKGYLVRTAGFDAVMLAIGNALFPDRIGVHETEKYLNNRTGIQIENYEKEYRKLTEREESSGTAERCGNANKSEDELQIEIDKITDRGNASESERQRSDQMTAWDYRRQAERYYRAKQYKRAIEFFSRAIRKQPNTSTFYNDRGCAYSYLHEHEKAISDFNKAIEINPEYSNAYNNRGFEFSTVGEMERAFSDYGRAIELDPNYAEPYNNRGIAYWRQGEYERAFLHYNKAIELNPEYGKAYCNRGVYWNHFGQYEKAISDLEKAIALIPESPNPYKHCGVAWKKKGDMERALAYLTKAIKLDPEYEEAYRERADAFRRIGEEIKAAADDKAADDMSAE